MFFFYLVNNSIIPSGEKIFRNYILKNTKKWKNKGNSKNSRGQQRYPCNKLWNDQDNQYIINMK